ncbi:MAG: DUF3857 domain-containing transglutaminase family protein [Terriglobales bacterium]
MALVSFPTTVHAQEGFQPVSPDELKMTSEPLAPGAPAIILYRQVDRDDDIRFPHENNYSRIKILTEEGRKNGDIEIPFFKQSEDVIHIRARTIKPDGSIVNFDGQVLEKSIAKSRFGEILAKTFALPDVQVGSIIEYSYTLNLKENYVYDSHWILNEALFTKFARFSLKPTGTMAIRWSWQGLQPGNQPKQDRNGDHVIRMDATNIPAFQSEDFMPPENELKSRVDFIYENELFAKDADAYWKKVGKARNEILENFIGKRKAMEQAVAQIVSPADSAETKLRRIYDRVQLLRNTSYEVQKTEQELKRNKDKVADNVEDVWKRGYGDAFQLTWLFLALVRAAGFEAYGCWVSDRKEYFFSRSTMQGPKLNVNVVLVKLNGQDLYLDPGVKFIPYGLLGWSETGTPGLRLDKDGGTWITTTVPPSSQSCIERRAKLRLSENGDLDGTLTATYTGLEASGLRSGYRESDAVARKKLLEEELKGQVPVGIEVELTNQPDWNASETPLVAEFHIRVPGWASGAGRRVVLPVGLLSAAEKHMFEHSNRIHSVYFEYPYEKRDDVTIELPSGWQVASLPTAENRDAQAVAYTLKAEKENGGLHLERKLSVDILLLKTQYYASLRSFFQIVRSTDEQQVILQPGPASASK